MAAHRIYMDGTIDVSPEDCSGICPGSSKEIGSFAEGNEARNFFRCVNKRVSLETLAVNCMHERVVFFSLICLRAQCLLRSLRG